MAQSDESPPAGETTRRARKRETDRRAQREHRQRQKAYVRQLEEVVKDLTAQQSPDDRVVALQAEKARLHARCNALSAKLERIRLAACVDDLQSVEGGKETMHSLPMSPPTTENVASGGEDAYMPFTTSLDPSLTRPQALSDKTALVDLGTLDPAAMCSVPPFDGHGRISNGSKWMDDPLLNLDAFLSHPETAISDLHNIISMSQSNLDLEGTSAEPPQMTTSDDGTSVPGDIEPAVADTGGSQPFMPGELSTQEEFTGGNMDLRSNDLSNFITAGAQGQYGKDDLGLIDLSHKYVSLLPTVTSMQKTAKSLCFPRYSRPSCHSDTTVINMIEEARHEHQQGRFDLTRPTLRRILSDLPVDCLSFRLFHFISAYGAMPMHNFLATFWVQYLFLRWQVLGTLEAYEQVPTFMRPTPLECLIPHQVFMGMLVWPNLRQALVRDSHKVDVESIGIALLRNLDSNWCRDAGGGGAEMGVQPGSLDVFEMIDRQACSIGFWKVKPAFFLEYPQYRDSF